MLVVKTGHTYPEMVSRFGDFEAWVAACLDPSAATIETISPFAGEALPEPLSVGGIIVTGSHDMVTDRQPWSEMTADWIKRAVESDVPLLGICYGHQLLAHAMGGAVADNPNGKEIGTVTISLTGHGRRDRLFAGMPATFAAHACHTQSVLRLPEGATLLASSAADAHHAFAIGKRAWGVQFHPEFSAQILRQYIQRAGEELGKQGDDIRGRLAAVQETPQSRALLRRFQRLCA
jgi:GMP synthase (glutamine-hydrolysing)